MKVKFKQLPPQIEEMARSSNSLKMALRRLSEGSKPTPRSWFYEDKSAQWIVDTVKSKLSGMHDWEVISQWDLSKSEKYAPQGGSAPLAERLDTLNEYFEHLDRPSILDETMWKMAKSEVVKRLKFNNSGAPVSAETVVARGISEDKYNTSSGYPLFMKRKRPEAQEEAIRDASSCISSRFPCVLGTRASMGKTGKDARHIFMASMAVNVNGQRFQQPLQDYIRSLKQDFFLPWEGWDAVQAAISSNWDTTSLKFGADYIKMDQHLNKYHGFEVFDVIKHYFKRSYWDELHQIISYVFEMPIITNLGYIDQEHAMPSGSEWTNFIETMWNFMFTVYLELKYKLKFKLRCGIGDDQLWILSGDWTEKNIKWVVDTVIKEFDIAGLPGNPEKQEVALHKTGFLQRLLTTEWNGSDGTVPAAGVYSLIRNVTSQVYPEFYHNEKDWDASMFALRVIMIAENCCNHPLFEWYVKDFIAKSNPNVLEFVRQSDDTLRAKELQAKRIANFLPTYNQEKQGQSILDFHTVRLLREVM
nr:MAG: RNA-dependent RNA polymerase [Porcine picobirnavirus]